MAFKLIAITPELTLPDETWRIAHLLDAGFDAVHLRKPHCGEEEMRGYVDTLPAGIADRLAMHYFPDVAAEKGIGGVHLNKRSPRVPEGWKGAVSRSCHSLEEVADSRELDYVFLSPVFDSISKQGYASHFSEEQLRGHVDARVMALGGVTAGKIPWLADVGFGGCAFLGYLFGVGAEEFCRRVELIVEQRNKII